MTDPTEDLNRVLLKMPEEDRVAFIVRRYELQRDSGQLREKFAQSVVINPVGDSLFRPGNDILPQVLAQATQQLFWAYAACTALDAVQALEVADQAARTIVEALFGVAEA